MQLTNNKKQCAVWRTKTNTQNWPSRYRNGSRYRIQQLPC